MGRSVDGGEQMQIEGSPTVVDMPGNVSLAPWAKDDVRNLWERCCHTSDCVGHSLSFPPVRAGGMLFCDEL